MTVVGVPIITKHGTKSTQHIYKKKTWSSIIEVHQDGSCKKGLAITYTYELGQHFSQTKQKTYQQRLSTYQLLFLCLFGLGLDWLSMGGGGPVVSLLALPIAGLFEDVSLAACKHKHKHNGN